MKMAKSLKPSLTRLFGLLSILSDFRGTARQPGTSMKLQDIKAGDLVTRVLGGSVRMQLRVTEVADTLIVCGPWQFSRATGAEVDEELGWGENGSGSFLEAER